MTTPDRAAHAAIKLALLRAPVHLSLEVHDLGHDQPTLCIALDDGHCIEVAEFTDSDSGRQAAQQLATLLEALEADE